MKMNINNVIKELRIAKGLSQEFLAENLNVDTTAISNIERGRRHVKVNELAIFAKCFNMSVVDLVGYPYKYVRADGAASAPVANSARSAAAADAARPTADKVTLQIELQADKREQVLKLVFGENNIEMFNK